MAACFIAVAVIFGAAVTGSGLNNMFLTVGAAMQNAANAVRGDSNS